MSARRAPRPTIPLLLCGLCGGLLGCESDLADSLARADRLDASVASGEVSETSSSTAAEPGSDATESECVVGVNSCVGTETALGATSAADDTTASSETEPSTVASGEPGSEPGTEPASDPSSEPTDSGSEPGGETTSSEALTSTSLATAMLDAGTSEPVPSATSFADASVLDTSMSELEAGSLDASVAPPLDAALPETNGTEAAPDSGQANDAATADAAVGLTGIAALEVLADEITVDGDLSEWGANAWITVPAANWVLDKGPATQGGADLTARFALRFSATDLYLAAEVEDDALVNNKTDYDVYDGDCLQLGFVWGPSDAEQHYELVWAMTTGNTPRVYRWEPSLALPTMDYVVTRTGTTTRYEIRLTAADLGVTAYGASLVARMSVLVGDSDDMGGSPQREGYLELTPGIGGVKSTAEFLPVSWD